TLLSATVHERGATRARNGRTPRRPDVLLYAPRLEVLNRTGRAVTGLLVRCASPISRDLLWEDLAIDARGRAELELDPTRWSQTVERGEAAALTLSIAGVRFADGEVWLDDAAARAESDRGDGSSGLRAPRPETPLAPRVRAGELPAPDPTPRPEAREREMPAPTAETPRPTPEAFAPSAEKP